MLDSQRADASAAQGLAAFVEACPSMFHTIAQIRAQLDAAGFT